MSTYKPSFTVFLDELIKLSEEGYGRVITKDQMYEDKLLPFNQCATVYMKPEPSVVDKKFFHMCMDKDVSESLYEVNFNKSVDETMKKMIIKYHPQRELILLSQVTESGNLFSYK